jgi:alkylhydroperoxidase family enzyme
MPMARIEPIPFDELPEASRAMIEEGMANGMYTNALPLQIVAYSSVALRAMHEQYRATFRQGLLEPRLVELLRLHSAQAGACEPCSASRKDDTISEDDVACLIEPDESRFTAREYRALKFFDLLAGNHHAIDDDTFRSLAEVFTGAEIVELGFLCSQNLGGHRFMHTLGIFNESAPLVAFSPDEIDRSQAQAEAEAAL